MAINLDLPVPISKAAVLAAWLESHDLHNGIGSYWAASIVTVESGGRVEVRPVVSPDGIADRPLQPQFGGHWYANPSSSSSSTLEPLLGRDVTWQTAVNTFGALEVLRSRRSVSGGAVEQAYSRLACDPRRLRTHPAEPRPMGRLIRRSRPRASGRVRRRRGWRRLGGRGRRCRRDRWWPTTRWGRGSAVKDRSAGLHDDPAPGFPDVAVTIGVAPRCTRPGSRGLHDQVVKAVVRDELLAGQKGPGQR